jgi:hypothetical protein
MPGSIDNPVVLDPWQAIIEVGWPRGKILYIAVSTRLDQTGLSHSDQLWTDYCTVSTSDIYPGDFTEVIGGPGMAEASIHYHATVTDPDRTLSYYAWFDPQDGSALGWKDLVLTPPDVTGLPDVSANNSFGEWTFSSSTTVNVGWRLTPASGDEWSGLFPASRLPDNPAAFNSGLAPEYVIRSRGPYTEDPKCWKSDAVHTFVRYGSPIGAPQDILTEAFNLSGVSATIDGQTFAAVSTGLISGDNDGSDLHQGSRSTLWVLCEPTTA